MPNYKFYYFDARARGEPVRMLFALAGQQYEDVLLSLEEWFKTKNDRTRFPLGKLPTLEVDGRLLAESKAIWRYLAREFGYFGNNKDEDYEIDLVCEIVADMENLSGPVYEIEDEAKRSEFLLSHRNGELKPLLEYLQKGLRKSSGRYYLGDRLTLADVAIWNALDFFVTGKFKISGFYDPYPTLQKWYDDIRANSPLTDYLNKRRPSWL